MPSELRLMESDDTTVDRGEDLRDRYRRVRQRSIADCAPLQAEDYVLQAAAFASPPKWHLAHTTGTETGTAPTQPRPELLLQRSLPNPLMFCQNEHFKGDC